MRCLLLASLLVATPALAQQYTLSQTNGNDTFGARSTGQTFTPGVGIVPVGAPPVLLLTQVELFHGNFIANSPSATTYLDIYDGDPNASGNFVGSSTNFLDTTTGLSFHDSMVWTFAQLPLLDTIEYWAVMSSDDVSGGLNVAVSLETSNRNTPSPGPYAGGSGLIANIAQHPDSVDAKFEITFFNGLLGSFTVSGAGCPSSVGLAALSAPTTPQLGTTFQVDLANLSPAGLPYLAIGLSDISWSGLPLPLPLAALVPSAPASCMILVRPDGTAPLTLNGTAASWTLPIPNASVLTGLSLYVQGIQLEPTGFSLTEKGTILIGD